MQREGVVHIEEVDVCAVRSGAGGSPEQIAAPEIGLIDLRRWIELNDLVDRARPIIIYPVYAGCVLFRNTADLT